MNKSIPSRCRKCYTSSSISGMCRNGSFVSWLSVTITRRTGQSLSSRKHVSISNTPSILITDLITVGRNILQSNGIRSFNIQRRGTCVDNPGNPLAARHLFDDYAQAPWKAHHPSGYWRWQKAKSTHPSAQEHG